MSIKIDERLCVGCGGCAAVCPGGLVSMNGAGRAGIIRPEDCWGCASCMKECHSGAISYFLGADIGGNGATLSVRDRGDILEWVFHRPDGTEKTIEVKRNESNKY